MEENEGQEWKTNLKNSEFKLFTEFKQIYVCLFFQIFEKQNSWGEKNPDYFNVFTVLILFHTLWIQ